MKLPFSLTHKHYVVAGLILILLTNIFILINVQANRTGKQEGQLSLSERELPLANYYYNGKENSAITLTIDWRVASKNKEYGWYYAKELPSSKAEIEALGFNANFKERFFSQQNLVLYWVLELNGEQYKQTLIKAEEAFHQAQADAKLLVNDETARSLEQKTKDFEAEKIQRSRLFVIEVGNDYQQLKEKYSANDNVVIVKGLTSAGYNRNDDSYVIRLDSLSVPSIMVPYQYRHVITKLTDRENQPFRKSRYTALVNWGSRLEPWFFDLMTAFN